MDYNGTACFSIFRDLIIRRWDLSRMTASVYKRFIPEFDRDVSFFCSDALVEKIRYIEAACAVDMMLNCANRYVFLRICAVGDVDISGYV